MCRGPRSDPTGSNMAHRINWLGLMGTCRNYSYNWDYILFSSNNWWRLVANFILTVTSFWTKYREMWSKRLLGRQTAVRTGLGLTISWLTVSWNVQTMWSQGHMHLNSKQLQNTDFRFCVKCGPVLKHNLRWSSGFNVSAYRQGSLTWFSDRSLISKYDVLCLRTITIFCQHFYLACYI